MNLTELPLATPWWAPRFVEPLGVATTLLLLCGWLALALTLHRASQYIVRRRHLAAGASTDLRRLAWNNPHSAGWNRYRRQYLAPRQECDGWGDRGLATLASVTPMIGLAGTVHGVILTLGILAVQQSQATLRELGGPVSLAMYSTLYGLTVSAACVVMRRMFPVLDLHTLEENAAARAWKVIMMQSRKDAAKQSSLTAPAPVPNPSSISIPPGGTRHDNDVPETT